MLYRNSKLSGITQPRRVWNSRSPCGTFCRLLAEPEAAERLKEGARGACAVVLADLDRLLDSDIVRRNLSSELGFLRAHRDLNVRRIGFVASEITKNGGVALCAPIAPYTPTRRAVRECIVEHGAFIFLLREGCLESHPPET